MTEELFIQVIQMPARKFAIARQLGGKRVITNKGEELGRISDIQFEEGSGDLAYILIDPNPESRLAKKLRKEEDLIVVPYKALYAVGDVVVVDESLLEEE